MIEDDYERARRHELAMMDKLVAILASRHAQTHGSSSNSYGMPFHNYSQQSYPFPTCSTNINEPNFVPNEPNINLTIPHKEILLCFLLDVHNALSTPTRYMFSNHSSTQGGGGGGRGEPRCRILMEKKMIICSKCLAIFIHRYEEGRTQMAVPKEIWEKINLKRSTITRNTKNTRNRPWSLIILLCLRLFRLLYVEPPRLRLWSI